MATKNYTPKVHEPIPCKVCGKLFVPINGNQKTCHSVECQNAKSLINCLNYDKRHHYIHKRCVSCGKGFRTSQKSPETECPRCRVVPEDELCTCCGKRKKGTGNRFLCDLCFQFNGDPDEDRVDHWYAPRKVA